MILRTEFKLLLYRFRQYGIVHLRELNQQAADLQFFREFRTTSEAEEHLK